MRLTNARNLLYTVGEHFRPKTEQERPIKAFWALVMLAIVLSSYAYYLYTS